MNVLTKEEFHLLAGTDLIIQMIRNRLRVHVTAKELAELSDYMEDNSTGFYYIDIKPTKLDEYNIIVHFEQPQDLSRIEQMLYMAKNSEE